MRKLLLLDLAGFRCGVWKEDVLSHEEQVIHWLTDNDGAVTAIAMMGAHPVSLADLSYCIGLASVCRARRCSVLVPADQDFSVSFVVEQEIGKVQVPSSVVFSLPAYLQTAFIDTCVLLDGQLLPLINIREIHRRISTSGYTPLAPQLRLPALKGKKVPYSLDSLRVFSCNKKSFAASVDYFFSEQALPSGVLTNLPLMPEFVRGITLHSNRVFTVLDICRYLQLSSATENGEEKWLLGEVEGQGFAFVVDADLGLLPADSAPLATLPLLVRSDWQQSVALHARKIIPVLDFSELLAKQSDEIGSQMLSLDLHADGRFEAVFGKQHLEIVEFSLCKMIHALPDLEVVDIIPFTHCQHLTGTKKLVAGVTLYRKELLPVLDPARCFGRESRPTADWKLLLVCNGDLRVLVLAEDVLGKRSLNVSEQRALPFTVPHSSVYGCYPVASRVGLILNILALAVYFDDEQISELFFFADDLLPLVNDVDKSIESNIEPNIDQETWRTLSGEIPEHEELFLRDDFLGRGHAQGAELLSFGDDDGVIPPESLSFFEGQKDESSLLSLESGRENSANDGELEKKASVLLTEEQYTLVQSVVASMLSRKKDVATYAGEKDNQDDEAVADSLEFAEELEGFGEIREESGDVFPSVVAAMLSRKEDDPDSEAGVIRQDEEVVSDLPECAPELEEFGEPSPVADEIFSEEGEYPSETERHEDDSVFPYENEIYENETSSTADTSLKVSSVLLTDEQDRLITSALASMLLRGKENKEKGGFEIHEELEGEQGLNSVLGKLQRVIEPVAESQGALNFSSGFDESLLQDNEQQLAVQSVDEEGSFFDSEDEDQNRPPRFVDTDIEELSRAGSGSDIEPAMLTEKQESLLQSALTSAFHQEEDQENDQECRTEGEREQESATIPDTSEGTAESEKEDPFLSREGDTLIPSEDPDEGQSDVPVIIFTEEQNALLQSSLAAAFFQEKDERSIEGQQGANVINAEFSPAAAHEADKKGDSVDSVDEQMEKTTTKEPGLDIKVVGGTAAEDLPHDVPVQLKDREEAPVEPDTWKILEDADAFPELKDFVRQVSGTQQADSPLVMPNADFVKNVTFPPLSSLDPRKIKAKLDENRQKKRDILFQKTAGESEEGLNMQPQPRNEGRKRTKLGIFLILLGLLSGFLFWLFLFRNQEVLRGKNIESEPQLYEIKIKASHVIRGSASGKRVESEVAVKNKQENIPAQPVAYSPDLSESESESESALEGQEAFEQEIPEALADQPAQATSERPVMGNLVEELSEKMEYAPESVLENTGKQQGETAIREQGQEQGQAGKGLVENSYEQNKKPDALPQGRVADDSADDSGDGAVDGAADDDALKNAVGEEKDLVKGSIGFSSDDAANKSEKESTQQNVTAALKRIKRTPEEPDTAQAGADEKKALESVLENTGKRQGKTAIREQGQEQGQAEKGLVENSYEQDKKPDALPQGLAADDSVDGAANDVVLKSAVAEEKDFVKDSIGASFDDAANKSEKESTQQNVTAALKRIKKTPEEPDTAQAEIVAQEKTTGVDLSKEKTIPAVQKNSALMSPVNGTSDNAHHTVSKGDTLWEISEQYTGSGFNYPDVAKKNKIADPDLIYPNQQVTLPAKK